ncbi:hypothetical protein FRC19_004923 [Serendipita sp. 401]|nr:hypothetical protein FRC19_004923 [Serendipita sp. 401]
MTGAASTTATTAVAVAGSSITNAPSSGSVSGGGGGGGGGNPARALGFAAHLGMTSIEGKDKEKGASLHRRHSQKYQNTPATPTTTATTTDANPTTRSRSASVSGSGSASSSSNPTSVGSSRMSSFSEPGTAMNVVAATGTRDAGVGVDATSPSSAAATTTTTTITAFTPITVLRNALKDVAEESPSALIDGFISPLVLSPIPIALPPSSHPNNANANASSSNYSGGISQLSASAPNQFHPLKMSVDHRSGSMTPSISTPSISTVQYAPSHRQVFSSAAVPVASSLSPTTAKRGDVAIESGVVAEVIGTLRRMTVDGEQ